MIHQPNILIFTVFQKNKDLNTNLTNHNNTLKTLEALQIPIVQLKHNNYLSILVIGFEHRSTVESYCNAFHTEYMESHFDRHTYKNNTYIGKLVPTSKGEFQNTVTKQYFTLEV